MRHNEMLPAIPRQKVKVKTGETGNVLMVMDDGMIHIDLGIGETMDAYPKDCEPVPEEPRQFRCGDYAVSRHGYDDVAVIGKIQAMNITRTRFCIGGSWFDDIRFATPSEVAQYFN